MLHALLLNGSDKRKYILLVTVHVSNKPSFLSVLPPDGPEPAMVKGKSEIEMNDVEELICTAASNPPANFTWKFNGTLTPVKTATYKIEMARFKYSGLYTCEAHNAITGKTTTATHTLTVRGKIKYVCVLELRFVSGHMKSHNYSKLRF